MKAPRFDRALFSAYQFFREHAGYIVGESAACALRLAKAERYARNFGITFRWEHEQEAYEMGDTETEPPNEVLWCGAYYEDQRYPAASLGMIADPSRAYRRVVEAELALEVLHDVLSAQYVHAMCLHIADAVQYHAENRPYDAKDSWRHVAYFLKKSRDPFAAVRE